VRGCGRALEVGPARIISRRETCHSPFACRCGGDEKPSLDGKILNAGNPGEINKYKIGNSEPGSAVGRLATRGEAPGDTSLSNKRWKLPASLSTCECRGQAIVTKTTKYALRVANPCTVVQLATRRRKTSRGAQRQLSHLHSGPFGHPTKKN
jgi:hypothetical protein